LLVLQVVSATSAAKDAAVLCCSHLNKVRAHLQLRADSSSDANTADIPYGANANNKKQIPPDVTSATTKCSDTTATARATVGTGSRSRTSASTECGLNPLFKVCCRTGKPVYGYSRYVHTLHARTPNIHYNNVIVHNMCAHRRTH
jgi:hypothetical protein